MNFALILFVLTVFTGVLYAADKLVFRKQRRAKADRLLADFDARNRVALDRREPIVEQLAEYRFPVEVRHHLRRRHRRVTVPVTVAHGQSRRHRISSRTVGAYCARPNHITFGSSHACAGVASAGA